MVSKLLGKQSPLRRVAGSIPVYSAQKWLTAALFDWTIIVLAVCLSYISLWFLPLSILVVGNRQHALSILGHDGAHRLISKNRKLNDFLTNAFVFFPLAICMKNYRKFHWEHHRHNGKPGLDPELPMKEPGPFPITGKFSKKKVFTAAAFDLIGFGIPQILAFLLYIRPRNLWECIPLIFAISVSIMAIITGYWLAILIWWVSLLTSFWSVFRLRAWSEHAGGGVGETLLFNPNWIQKVCFLPHNTWLHLEHHRKPGVPFWQLPEIRKEQAKEDLCEARIKNTFRNS